MRTFLFQHLEQGQPGFFRLHILAGINTLHALGAGEFVALRSARFEAHRAGVFAGGIAVGTEFGATAVEGHDHGVFIAHPYQTLEYANRAAKAAEQVAGEGEFNAQ